MIGRLRLYHVSYSQGTVTFLELGQLMLFGSENGGFEKRDEMLKRGANVEKNSKLLPLAALPAACCEKNI